MSELVLNPHVEIVLKRRGGELDALTVRAPRRGRWLGVTDVARAEEPVVFDVLRRAAEGRAIEANLDDAAWARLVEMGFLLPEGEVPRAVFFRCSPWDPPRGLVPPRERRAAPARGRLRVAPSLRYDDAPGAPEEGRVPADSFGRRRNAVRGRAEVNAFDPGCAWARVEHADRALPGLLSVDEADRALFRRLAPGEAPPAELGDEALLALALAGVLVDPEEEAPRRAAWAEARATVAAGFQGDRYGILRGMIPPAMLAAVRRYYRQVVAEGYADLDTSIRNRYCAHNEPMARFIHLQLAELVAEIAGRPVKPSYVYFARYRPGAQLRPHTDRAQCPISISLLLDYQPEPDDVSPWPLHLATRRGDVAASLGPGDGLFYNGIELRHWRYPLPEGHMSTALFLHYVPVEFTGVLD